MSQLRAGIAKNGAANGKTFHEIERSGDPKRVSEFRLRRIEAKDDDASGVFVMSFDSLDRILPSGDAGHRFQFPPIWIDAEAIKAFNNRCSGHVVDGPRLWRG